MGRDSAQADFTFVILSFSHRSLTLPGKQEQNYCQERDRDLTDWGK